MKPPLVSGIVRVDHATFPATGVKVPLHQHHFFQLDAILKGSVTLLVEQGEPLTARPGDAWLIPPLFRHGYFARGQFTQRSFKFYVSPSYWKAFSRKHVRFVLPPALRDMLRSIGETDNDLNLLAGHSMSALLTLCLVEAMNGEGLTRTLSPADAFERRLWPLLDAIAGDPMGRWNVQSLAEACCVSTDHFSRKFVELPDFSPRDYLQGMRLRAAADELLSDRAPAVKEIARKAGYASVHAFTRAFTRHMSTGPAAYRRQSGAMQETTHRIRTKG